MERKKNVQVLMIMSDDEIFSTDRHRFELITKYSNEKQRKNPTRNAEKRQEWGAEGASGQEGAQDSLRAVAKEFDWSNWLGTTYIHAR